MKKILLTLAMLLTAPVFAAQTIFVYWPFGPGDFSVAQLKAIFDKANSAQDEYSFVFASAPGAAGVIAANKTLSDNNALLAHSSAFFIRPLLFSNTTSYTADDFRMTAALSVTPFALVSRNGFSLPTNRNQQLSIGVGGLGSTTHVIATALKKVYPNLLIVPYKTLTEINADVISGNIDLGLDFIRSAEQHKDLKILGITGKKKIKNYQLLQDLGVEGSNVLVSDLFIVRPKTMPAQMGNRIVEILRAGMSENAELKKLDDQNFTNPHGLLTQDQLDAYYQTQQKHWQHLTKNVKVD